MPPKASTAKKADQKQKQKKIEDKTFGLKNKGKSKTVQKYVQTVAANVNQKKPGAPDRKALKEAKKREEDEMKALFNDLLTKKDKEKQAQAKDANDEDKVEEAVDTRTLEEKIEDDRRALNKQKGTPVTEETFLKWKAARDARRAAEAAKAAKAKAKKGLKGVSGRALFNLDASLFKDDDGAVGTDFSEFVDPVAEETKPPAEVVAQALDESLYLEDVGADDLDDLDDD